MAKDNSPSLVAKVIGLGAGLGAAFVAHKVLDVVWSKARGHKPPDPAEPGDAKMAEVLIAATISGALVALARALAAHGTANFGKKVDEPPEQLKH